MSAVLEAMSAEAGDGGNTEAAGADPAGSAGTPAGGATGQQPADAGTPAPASGSGGAPANPGDTQAADKLVPLAALHESRAETKRLKEQITALEQQPKLTPEDAELLKGLREQRATAQAPKDPDFLEDPRGYVDANQKRMADAVKKLEESNARRESIETQQRELQGLLHATAGHEQEFVKSTPDYYQAVEHMRNIRGQQLAIWYPQATADQIRQQIAQEEIAGAAQALRANMNPAQAAYNYAKTFGYAPKPPNGAAGAPQPAPADLTKEAARSLGGTGGDVSAEEDETPGMPELTAALAERFGAKKRK